MANTEKKDVKEITLINKKDRYFNGVGLNGIIKVPEDKKDYYLRNGFTIFKGIIEKKENIVSNNSQEENKETKAITKQDLANALIEAQIITEEEVKELKKADLEELAKENNINL